MLTNYFFVEVLRGLQDRMAESEYDLLVFSARTMKEMDAQLDRALQRGLSAGVLVFSTPITEARAKQLLQCDQSVVLVDSASPGFESISADNELGGMIAVRHLIECGARRIALIMGAAESIPAAQRHQGYLGALAEAGIVPDVSLVIEMSDELHHGYTEAAGYEAMKRLLAQGEPPDAVFATSDVQAVGSLQALAEAGIRVPEQIRVVGFDDIMLSRHIGLTTIRQPMYQMGALAADRLIHQIDSARGEPGCTVLSPRLMVRHTTDRSVPAGLAVAWQAEDP